MFVKSGERAQCFRRAQGQTLRPTLDGFEHAVSLIRVGHRLLQGVDVLACFEFQPLIRFELDPLQERRVDLIGVATDDDRGVPALS